MISDVLVALNLFNSTLLIYLLIRMVESVDRCKDCIYFEEGLLESICHKGHFSYNDDCNDFEDWDNDDFIKGLEQLRKGLDSFKHNLEVAVEQCNETLKRLKEEYDL